MSCMSMNKKNQNLFFWHVKDFLKDMRIELKSERTIETYRESLDNFRKYLSVEHMKEVDKVTIGFVTDDLLRGYLHYVAKNNSICTRNIRLAALKSYVKYASRKDMDYLALELNLSKIKSKKVHAKTHNWLAKDQVLLLLEQPKRTKTGIRDRFIMLFLFATGARLNEMLQVRPSDIILNGQYPYVKLLGKGNKPRIVPLSDNAFVENYKYYISLYHKDSRQDNYLFYTVIHGRNNKMSEDNVQRILKKYGREAHLIDPTIPSVHPHLLRHSYGAQLYRLGLSLAEIAKLLGHAEISTTEVYAETDEDMINEALEKMLGEQPKREWDNLSEEQKLKVLGLK